MPNKNLMDWLGWDAVRSVNSEVAVLEDRRKYGLCKSLTDWDYCKKFMFEPIVAEHTEGGWAGTHKYVRFWCELANGYAVGFNENPARGWSYPVIKLKK